MKIVNAQINITVTLSLLSLTLNNTINYSIAQKTTMQISKGIKNITFSDDIKSKNFFGKEMYHKTFT